MVCSRRLRARIIEQPALRVARLKRRSAHSASPAVCRVHLAEPDCVARGRLIGPLAHRTHLSGIKQTVCA